MFTARVRKIRSAKSPWQVFQEIHRTREKCFFLDSIEHRRPDQAYSYIGFDPFAEITLDSKFRLTHREGGRIKSLPAVRLIPHLRSFFRKYRIQKSSGWDFFTGGAVGFWGYELASIFEPKIRFRAKPGAGTPHLYLGFFSRVIIYDHRRKIYFLVLLERAGKKSSVVDWKSLECYVSGAERTGKRKSFSFKQFRPEIPQKKFEAMTRKAKAYIAAGDIYQANLSQRFSFQFRGETANLYDALRKINPSPFASFLKIGSLEILSSSPERLVNKRGRICETKPIAGTRPRPKNVKAIREMSRELLTNEKERAEHIMLVDLARNDLGRVSDWKTVRVVKMMEIEKYSHVLHIVSTVRSQLAKGRDGLDLIRAMFPGGTITGCPKIRCMEIIDELEPVQRGIYTGSIGYLDFNGNLDFNIVIRTLILKSGRGYLQAGAGIVFDSDPKREYEETLHKGEAMAEALVRASL